METMRRLLLLLLLPAGAVGQQIKPVIRALMPPDTALRDYSFTDSPNGRLFGYQSGDEAYILDRSTGKRSSTGLGSISQASWSPIGDRITFIRQAEDSPGSRVWVVDVDPNTGMPNGPARRVSLSVGAFPRFSPDAALIAFKRFISVAHSSIVVVPANGGRERVLYTGAVTPGRLSWSADGKWVYFVARATEARGGPGAVAHDLVRVSVSGGTPQLITAQYPGQFLGLSADGRIAAVAAGNRAAVTLRAVNSSALAIVDLPADVAARSWSTSGMKLFAFQKVWPTALFAIDIATGNVRPFSGAWAHDHDPDYSPDGRKVVFRTVIDGRNRLVLSDGDGRNRRVLPTELEPLGEVRWSPDGRRLGFVGAGLANRITNHLTVYDVRSGEHRQLAPAAAAARIIWRKDGNALVNVERPTTDSLLYVDVDLQGRTTPLTGLRGGMDRLRPVRGDLINDQWLAILSDVQIELRNLRDQRRIVVHRGSRGDNPTFNNVLGISLDGQTIALALPEENAAGRKWVTKLVSLRADASSIIETGMEEDIGSLHWLPDGRSVIAPGYLYPQGSIKALIQLVPLNGEPRRDLFANVKAADWGDFSISPDGRTLLVTAIRSFGGQAVEVDLSEALKNMKLP
jgi:Tol biopolymer transport system component